MSAEVIEKEKRRYPRAEAIRVASELCVQLRPVTDRLIVAGSLRRRKEVVGDVEILYVPRREARPHDLFSAGYFDLAEERIAQLLGDGALNKRLSKIGTPAWGAWNKLAVHRSGIPVDLFAATEANWWNYLVCRTGPAVSNARIAAAAIARGWKWNPYGAGFTRGTYVVTSEEDVFRFVGLPFVEPWARL
jgi:DNA polymerase (family 10)